jgi:hypothetical protein
MMVVMMMMMVMMRRKIFFGPVSCLWIFLITYDCWDALTDQAQHHQPSQQKNRSNKHNFPISYTTSGDAYVIEFATFIQLRDLLGGVQHH